MIIHLLEKLLGFIKGKKMVMTVKIPVQKAQDSKKDQQTLIRRLWR